MALSKNQLSEIKKHLETAQNPMFFFDDDCDGLCSFLLFKKFCKGRGKGIIVKGSPKLEEKYVKQVRGYSPDKIFVWDKPIVSQEFIDKISVPIIWIDHHPPIERQGIKYFNPRLKNPNDKSSTTYWCYKVTKQNEWLAMVGCIADWAFPGKDLAEKFFKGYGDLCPDIKDPETILFSTKFGELIKTFSFILKGTAKEAIKYINIIYKIESPHEIINNETLNAKQLNERAKEVDKRYNKVLRSALDSQQATEDIFVFMYHDKKMSFTADLSNELLHIFPEKIIIIARTKDGEAKISLRSKNIPIIKILTEALNGINGYGGGHDYACGATIAKEDFQRFIGNIKSQLEYTKSCIQTK